MAKMWTENEEDRKNVDGVIITKECFFLELRSNVVWYSISTKFFRHGTLTSFFTAWGWTSCYYRTQNVKNYIHDFSIEFKAEEDFEEILTAATGIRISTKRPARACFISLSLTSKKYWAHSYEKITKVQLIFVSSIQPILARICSLILASSFFFLVNCLKAWTYILYVQLSKQLKTICRMQTNLFAMKTLRN